MKSKKAKTNYTIPKERSKKVITALLVIVVFLNVLYLVLSSFTSTIYDESIYFKMQEKSGVYENLNETFAKEETAKVIDFLSGKNPELESNFLNENEISHFRDVKNLVKKGFIFYYIELFILFLMFVFYYEYSQKGFAHCVSRVMIFSGIAAVLLVALLFFLNFSSLFNSFHVAFFEGNYSFPEGANILKLFPENFFSGFFRIIISLTLFKAVILILLGLTINSLDYFRRLFMMRR